MADNRGFDDAIYDAQHKEIKALLKLIKVLVERSSLEQQEILKNLPSYNDEKYDPKNNKKITETYSKIVKMIEDELNKLSTNNADMISDINANPMRHEYASILVAALKRHEGDKEKLGSKLGSLLNNLGADVLGIVNKIETKKINQFVTQYKAMKNDFVSVPQEGMTFAAAKQDAPTPEERRWTKVEKPVSSTPRNVSEQIKAQPVPAPLQTGMMFPPQANSTASTPSSSNPAIYTVTAESLATQKVAASSTHSQTPTQPGMTSQTPVNSAAPTPRSSVAASSATRQMPLQSSANIIQTFNQQGASPGAPHAANKLESISAAISAVNKNYLQQLCEVVLGFQACMYWSQTTLSKTLPTGIEKIRGLLLESKLLVEDRTKNRVDESKEIADKINKLEDGAINKLVSDIGNIAKDRSNTDNEFTGRLYNSIIEYSKTAPDKSYIKFKTQTEEFKKGIVTNANKHQQGLSDLGIGISSTQDSPTTPRPGGNK